MILQVTLDMTGHANQIDSINFCREVRCLSAYKNQLDPSLPPWDIANILQTVCFGMPGYGHQKQWYQLLVRSLMFIFMWKINFIHHLFLEILLRYCKIVYLSTLGMYGYAQQKQ